MKQKMTKSIWQVLTSVFEEWTDLNDSVPSPFCRSNFFTQAQINKSASNGSCALDENSNGRAKAVASIYVKDDARDEEWDEKS